MCNVDLVFKPAGEDVKVLILHSTEDQVGKDTADGLVYGLKRDVKVVGNHDVPNFKTLTKVIHQKKDSFNVLVLIAHGGKSDNLPFLYDDGYLRYHELKAALEGKVDDKLCLFGVCYLGTNDLAEWICNEAGAMACIAPQPNVEICQCDIEVGFETLLNKMQEQKHYASDVAMLHKILKPELNDNIKIPFCIFPVSPQKLY